MKEVELPGAETAPPKEHEQEERPRIYVASLSDYNAGRLHGTWVDADQDTEAVESAITAMLADSPEPRAEEWAIHDYEHFGPLNLSEYESIEHVAAIARGMHEHGMAFAHWADYLGSSELQRLEVFDDHYRGSYGSLTEFAEELLDDSGIDIDSLGPEHLSPYISFDVDAFARDLSYDFHIADDEEGVHVFEHL